jgi:hypothetical protein
VADFKYDMFISYAHLDDNPDEGVRWVTSLQDVLAVLLRRRLGRVARIWRDTDQLKTLEDFENKIFEALRESASMVLVTTPAFVKREWFTKEYEQFLAAEKPALQDRTRVLIVYKTKMAKDELPEYFRQFIGFHMFREDAEGAASTLKPTGDTCEQFFVKCSDIAIAIQELIAPSDGPSTT